MKKSPDAPKEDDCCMTAAVNKGVYVVGKQTPSATPQPKVDARKIAEAVKRTSAYKKK